MNRGIFLVVLVGIATIVFFSLPEKGLETVGDSAPVPVAASGEGPGVPDAPDPSPDSQGALDDALPLPSSGTALNIVGVYPPGDEIPSKEIIFYFNEALAPFQPPAGTTEQPVSLEPPINGATVIQGNYLRFAADNFNALFEDPQVNELKITLHENLRSVSGQSALPENCHYVFTAPRPTIAEKIVDKITDDEAAIKITFSRIVQLNDLQGLMTVKDRNQEPVPFTVSCDVNGYEAFLHVPLTVALPVDVEIAEGLPWGEESQYRLGKISLRYPTGFSLQQPKALLNTKDEVYIDLQFEEPLPFDWLDRLVTIKRPNSDEPIPFTVTFSDFNPHNTVRLLLPETDEMAALEEAEVILSPWLRSEDGTRHAFDMIVKAKKTISLDRRNGQKQPFQLYYNYWETKITDGLVLRLNFSEPISPAELQSHIEIVPPVDSVVVEGGSYSRNLLVKGAFKSETDYTLRIKGGLKNDEGEVALQQDASFALEKTPLQKGVAFDKTNLYYFPRRDMANPKVLARNATTAAVTLAQVFPSNLPVFVRDFSQSGANPYLLAQYAREIGKTEIAFPDTRDTLLTNAVDLNTLLPAEARGVFIMNTSPAYDYENNSRILIYTDLGALTHWTNQELVVFVHHLYTLEPQAGAKVTVYSSKFQPIGATYTNDAGIARFMSFEAAFGAPAMAVIEADNDYTFINLLEQQDTKTAFTESMPPYDKDGYDGYIYLDRNLYRPGETVHVRWIARTQYVDAVTDVPFQLRIANPKGRWIYEAPVTPSEFGTGSFSFKTEQTHPTGRYRVELRVPKAPHAIGEAVFNLEDFVPNRMRTSIAFDADKITAGQTVNIAMKAENLYGGPAAGKKSDARIYLRPTVYKSEACPGYHFGNEDTLEEKLTPLGEVVTDENGLASYKYTFTAPPGATMPLEAVVGGRVFEVGGRAVSGTDAAIALPFDVMLGIAAAPRQDQEILDVHVAAIRSDDTFADLASVQLTLEREEWNYHIRSFSESRQTYWDREFRTVQTLDVSLTDGKGTVELPYPSYGKYRLRVHSPETPMYSALLFDRWWGRLNIVSSLRPDLVTLSVDKEIYHAGDQVNLRIECPYDGTAFVVVQGEQILDQMVVPVIGGEGKVTLVVPHNWFPNAWIEATVVRNTEKPEGAQYPYSSFGMVNVPLDAPDRRIEVKLLDVPEEIRPSEPYTVQLTTSDVAGAPLAAEVTVAAVDEGIHGILGYENPDPYAWFQRSRQFPLKRAHYYDNVFYNNESSPIGGDMMRRLGLGSQVGENWIRPVALWSGTVTTDESGHAAITFEVPEFVGQLRLVAVAVTNRATGAAAANTFVRRPYMLRTGMPRFALPGDRFECTGTTINMTNAPVTAQLHWTASGTLSGTGEKQLELAPNGEASWRVPVVAGAATGQGMLTWTVVFSNSTGDTLETLTESAPIPVNSPAAYETETELITLAPGETRVIENTRFVNEPSLHTTLHVAGTPLWRLYPGLRYLLRYPYGCVEQVTSQAMPLYLLRNYAQLYKGLLPEDQVIDVEVVDTYIRYAVERLLMMQTNDGGLSTWAGGNTSYPYGSVYALHFLTLMRRDRAYDVYEEAFRSLQRYAAEIMRDERRYSKYPYNYYLRAYACYVLALDGNLEAIEYIPRFDHVAIPKSARYLLAAAKAVNTQDPGDLEAYIAQSPTSEFDSNMYSGILHSSTRAEAITLIALIQMNASPEKMMPLVDSLFTYFDERRYFSTQESSFVVTALGMYIEHFHKDSPESIAARIVAPDGEHTITGNNIFESVVPGAAPRYEIINTGALPLYINLEMSGLPLQPRTTPIAEGLNIKRTYLHEAGKPVQENRFAHRDQYIVELSIKPKRDLENLLIVDLLPAGFEVANPRLEPDIQPPDNQNENNNSNTIFTPAHLEVRDDRVAIAVDKLQIGKTYTFRYLVRAVTPGTFQLPALHAECMYQPTTRAATVTGDIVVE
jgi:alpha-2-macroglobulin